MISEHASPLAVLGGEDAGGQNVHVAALALALADRGHTVDVHTRRDDPTLPERVTLAPGVDVVHVPAGPARALPKDELAGYMPAFAHRLTAEWVDPRRRPDVVHAHFWMSGLAAARVCPPLGIPLVQTFHALGVVKRRYQGAADTSPPGRVDVEARLLRTVDAVVATCTDEVRELLALGARPETLNVVPCGVDVELFRPDGAPAPRTGGRRRLLAAGRLVERKGLTTAIEALAELGSGMDAELVVAGGPAAADLPRDPHAAELLARAERLGVADRVHLLGRVPHEELPALYRSADAVVAVPRYEPFGIVPLEAMASGVPVIASAVGGMLDTVEDGGTGLLVPPDDAPALAAAARRLLDDDRLRAALGHAGRRRAVRGYTWGRVAADTEAVYLRLAAPGAVAAAADGSGAGDWARQRDGVA
jgi:glycosyltransferase involved in cell wall biosynthesis